MKRHPFILPFCLFTLFTSAFLHAQPPRQEFLLEITGMRYEGLAKTLSAIVEKPEDVLLSHIRERAFVIATKAEADLLKERGVRCTVVMRDTSRLALAKRALYGPTLRMPEAYHTYDRILREGDELSRTHPGIIRRIPMGKTSRQGRDIFAFEIGRDAGTHRDVPTIMFDACHHSDEVMGAEICVALMKELVEKFGSDDRVTKWLETTTIIIIPVVNVDGHTIVTSGENPEWRKNGRGVDINRNYDFNWALGGSDEVTSDRYRGPYPFSESENRAMRDFLSDRKILLSISYHSQGEVIYFPWTWYGRKAPDDKLLASIAHGLAGSIRTMDGDSCYKAEYGAGTVGQTYPWLYGTKGTFDFVVETGKGAHIFPEQEISGIVSANLAGAHYILDRSYGPGLTGHVTDATTGKPLVADVWFPAIESEDVHRRTSDATFGRYWRLLSPGKYWLIVSRDGYAPQSFKNIEVDGNGWTSLNVRLEPLR